ncbi:MAG: hypothetical protein IPK83_02240 [Planctomycetes bacterium]|nr:hypothetical protein [Planctomycetota bacterium]
MPKRSLRRTVLVTSSLCFAFTAAACNGSKNRSQQSVREAAPTEINTVRIDAGNNGAAPARQASHVEERRAPRALVFEISGVAPIPHDGGTQEEWAAARESAVIDALAKAIMESRRGAGLSDENFVEKLAPRLTVAHRITDEGEEFELRLADRGMERLFLIRDGVLQHPPHDFQLVRKIFSETSGAFALLPVDEAPLNRYVARVGCYEQIGAESRLAGELRAGDASETGVGDTTPDAATP